MRINGAFHSNSKALEHDIPIILTSQERSRPHSAFKETQSQRIATTISMSELKRKVRMYCLKRLRTCFDVSPVASTMPSRITTISKSSFSNWACDMSQNGERESISWEMTNGDTRNKRSSPVSKPTLISVWSKGINSPRNKWTKGMKICVSLKMCGILYTWNHF